MDATTLRYYRKARAPHWHALGQYQGKAQACLNLARIKTWFDREWSEDTDGRYTSDDGVLRLSILPDSGHTFEDMAGDTFDLAAHGNTVHGGARTIKAQEKEYRAKLERDGVWGYVLERRANVCPTCGRGGEWEHADSCWGFDDADYCLEEGIIAAHSHATK